MDKEAEPGGGPSCLLIIHTCLEIVHKVSMAGSGLAEEAEECLRMCTAQVVCDAPAGKRDSITTWLLKLK